MSDVVRRAVEISDPDDIDQTLGRLEQQFEDDDEPVTAVDNLEERLAIALEGTDYDGDDPAVAVASAVVLYLAARPDEIAADRDPDDVIRHAVRAQWRGDAPGYVTDWLAGR